MKKNPIQWLALSAFVFLSVALRMQDAMKETFETGSVGKLPANWTVAFGNWAVATDGANKVLYQTAKSRGSEFNKAVAEKTSFKDGELSVRLKAILGRQDQGGGLMWRYRNPNNYYLVRANPLEKNVVFYKVENGKRTDLPLLGKGKTYGMDAPMATNRWHTLTIAAKGDLFTVFFDGKQLYQVKDNTFPESGKVGLWTKADAQTQFDDLMVN